MELKLKVASYQYGQIVALFTGVLNVAEFLEIMLAMTTGL